MSKKYLKFHILDDQVNLWSYESLYIWSDEAQDAFWIILNQAEEHNH